MGVRHSKAKRKREVSIEPSQFFVSTSSETKYECDNDQNFKTEIDKEFGLPYDAIETDLDEETEEIEEIDDPYDELPEPDDIYFDNSYIRKSGTEKYCSCPDFAEAKNVLVLKDRNLRHQVKRRNSQEGVQLVNKISTPRPTVSPEVYSDFRGAFKSDRKFYNKRQLKPRIGDIDSKDYVPQMVEAFRSLIEESVRVSEVLPYLPFLDDKEEIQAKEMSSPKQATRLLLDRLIASEELGKWTTFLDALKTVVPGHCIKFRHTGQCKRTGGCYNELVVAFYSTGGGVKGYQYITNILLGNTELDLSLHKNLLKIFIPEIINNVEPTELTDRLYSRDVISVTDKEEIECELRNRGASAASLKLLDRIPRRIENWYGEFVDALRACGFDFVANRIDLPEVQQSSIEESVSTAPSRHIFGHKKIIGVKTSNEYEPMSNTSLNDTYVKSADAVFTSNTSFPKDATEQWNTGVKTVISSDFTRKTFIENEMTDHCDTDIKTTLGSELTQKNFVENRATDQSDMGVKAVIGVNYSKPFKLTKHMAWHVSTDGYTRTGGSDATKPKILPATEEYITPTYVPHDPIKRGTVVPPVPPRPRVMYVEPTISTDSTNQKLKKTLSIRTSTLQEFLEEKKRLINEIEDMKLKRKIKRDIKFLQTLQESSKDSSDEDDVSIISINQEIYPKIMRLPAHGGERHDQVIQVDLEDIIKDSREASELGAVDIAGETRESRGGVKQIKTEFKEQTSNKGREVADDKRRNEAEEDKINDAQVVEQRLAAQTEANDGSAKVPCDKSLQETDKMANQNQATLVSQLDNISLTDFLNHFIQKGSDDGKMTTERNDNLKDIASKDLMDVLMGALRKSAKDTNAPTIPTVVSGEADEEGGSDIEDMDNLLGGYSKQGNSGNNLPKAHEKDMQRFDSGVYSVDTSMYFGAPSDYV